VEPPDRVALVAAALALAFDEQMGRRFAC